MTLDVFLKEERKAMNELRCRLKGEMDNDLYNDDNMFIRFLRARNFNLNATEAMLRNHLAWRKTSHLDTILTDFTAKEVFRKYMTLDHIGFDKEGYLIVYSQLGDLDTRGLLKTTSRAEIVKSTVQILEVGIKTMKEQSAKLGRTIDKWSYICNIGNLSLATATHTPTLQVISKVIQLYEANYPERLKAAYIINASVYFTLGYAVVKPFLSGPTVQKINIFGKDGWKEELLKVIDADVLPVFLGGNRTGTNGSPMCEDIINLGGPIPEHYFSSKGDNKFRYCSETKKLTVARLSRTELAIEVENHGSHIEWEFEVKGGDIDFSVLYKEGRKMKSEEILPKQRIDTGIVETGMLQCKTPGIYILEFDNNYSWFSQKEVFCNAIVVNSNAVNRLEVQ